MAKKSTPSNQSYKTQARREINKQRRESRIIASLQKAKTKRAIGRGKGIEKPAPTQRNRFSKAGQLRRRQEKIERAILTVQAGGFVPEWLKSLAAWELRFMEPRDVVALKKRYGFA